MILKASARGGASQLGNHLLKSENEHVEVHEVSGFMADSIPGALKEAQAVARGTRCKQHLFSVSLSPPESESVPRHVFEAAIDKIEAATGLTGQPRIIVFHEKEGRRHAHCVWSRIDADTMTAKPLPFFKMKLREVSKGLYLEHGWQMPRGLMDSKARDPRNFSLAEWQAAKRMGRDPRELKGAVQECWSVSDSRASFERALGERGVYLARGDSRAHVVVTYEGEILSLARLVGKKAKEVTAKLGKADDLANITDTRAHIAGVIAPRLAGLIAEADKKRSLDMKPLMAKRDAMKDRHASEREKLDTGQANRRIDENRVRSQRFRPGVAGLWDRLNGRHAETTKQNEAEAFAGYKRDRSQRDALVESQLGERRDLQKDIRAVRTRHAANVTELHRDLSRQNSARQPEQDREKLTDAFKDATTADAATRTVERPRIVRGRTRGTGRDGPGLG